MLTSQESQTQTKETSKNSMKCLIKEDLNKDGLTLKSDMPSPTLGLDEVKIKVLATSVCGTDKSIYNSAQSEGIRNEMQRYLNGKYDPIIVGHEFCGVVEEVGEAAKSSGVHVPDHLRIEKGDYVTAEMHLSCGHCFLCRLSLIHI